jgi:hypothetical protein
METNRKNKWEPLASEVISEDIERKQNSTSDNREDGYENEDDFDTEDIDYEEVDDNDQ